MREKPKKNTGGPAGNPEAGKTPARRAAPDVEHALGEEGAAALKSALLRGARELELPLPPEAADKFLTYARLLLGWNRVMNLTAITDPEEVALKHFADSLALLRYAEIPQGARVADVGCGAGFPGFPLKFVRGDLRLTCMDGLGKRIVFLEAAKKELGIAAACVHIRAEEAGRKPEYREKFEVVTARAVANLRVLAEYCLPLVKPGGIFLAMKAAGADREAAEALPAIGILGGRVEAVVPYPLPVLGDGRTLVAVRKLGPTPKSYPRPAAKIAKSPL